MVEPKKRDADAPPALKIKIESPDGALWGVIDAHAKQFSSGSVGFYANGKVENPISFERYQVGMNITLIGSKPDNK